MQRPVMNPSFFDEHTPARQRRRLLRMAGFAMWKLLRMAVRLLTYDPLARLAHFRIEDGTPTQRFVRGLMYRLAFVPVMVAAFACAIVWVGTHPRQPSSEINPSSQGIYYDAVTFQGNDKMRLEGWLMPLLDARTVLQEKEQVLRKKHPAVVLVHDTGQRREQMLPLIRPLHEAGFVVLAINLRGGGPKACAGETFGLHEASDVKAAVELLRRKPFVDPRKIALVGCGTGATAALLAAQDDPTIAAVVADRPLRDAKDLLDSRLLPRHAWLAWMAPVCKWTFEISYGVNADDVALKQFRRVFESRPVLMLDVQATHVDPSNPRIIEQVRSFLASTLIPTPEMAAVQTSR